MANPSKFDWVNPTANTDGSPVTPGEITGYTIGVGTSAGNYTVLTTVTDPNATTEPLANLSTLLKPATYFASIRAESVNGPSAWATEISFTIAPPAAPNAPTSFAAG
jgi:hypothetical protein